MPSRPRQQFTPAFKAKVAIEAIKGERTASQIARGFSVHPNLVGIWKRQALEGLPEVFASPRRAGLDQKQIWILRLASAGNGSNPIIPA